MRFPPCFKINDLRHCLIIDFGAAHSLCRTQSLIESKQNPAHSSGDLPPQPFTPKGGNGEGGNIEVKGQGGASVNKRKKNIQSEFPD